MSRIRPVIIAGGPGARLWPLSDAARPKPFLKLDGERSLLDHTIARFSAPELFAPPIVACVAAHADEARAALHAGGIAAPELILEPEPRDTAAAIAAVVAARRAHADGDERILIAPADHMIADVAAFRAACAAAADQASGPMLLFGARPTSPSEAFGYIEAGDRGAVAAVVAFHEKPGRARAESFLAGGAHLWNMGLFLAHASTFEALFTAHAPEIYAVAQRAVAEGRREDGALVLSPEVFARAPRAAFDRAVVEKASGLRVVRADCGWSDLGAWDAVHAALAPDAQGNVAVGDVKLLDASDTLVHSSGPLVAAIGVAGLAIVATADAVLVCRREDAQKVKALVEAMKKKP